jgi:Flp pilus assembly protein TadG
MLAKFWAEKSGNYSLATVFALVPILGGVGLIVDYSEMTRQRGFVMNALDAAGVATARRVIDGATDAELVAYAKDFFEANLGPVKPSDTELSIVLPDSELGGGVLTLTANLDYKPMLMPVFEELRKDIFDQNNVVVSQKYEVESEAQVRLKNTSEVALVLDNSGSMSNYGGGSSKKRIDLLKDAAKYLVQELARQSSKIKQVDKPVQFSVVPFSASVNVGPEMADKDWMDTWGLSPIHHENFDWSTMNAANDPNKYVEFAGAAWYKRGAGWGKTQDTPMTRFSLYADMQYYSSREFVSTGQEYICTKYNKNGTCKNGYWQDTGYYRQSAPASYATWQGCVEARPYPYDVNDSVPTTGNPATLFVPMFAPDEPGNLWRDIDGDGTNDLDSTSWSYSNNWWADYQNGTSNAVSRQKDMRKYFQIKPYGAADAAAGDGPNSSCTTNAITPLTDVTKTPGLNKVINAIDAMSPTGNTNVPEGMAWGWRTVSSAEPFTEGRAESEKGNDKVLIVLTDGLNTYSDLSDGDAAGNKSTYAAHGYTGVGYNSGSTTRLYLGTSSSVSKNTFTSSNYTKAMNEHMEDLCSNAKSAGVVVFTVGLDLHTTSDAAAISSLQACSSSSKFRKNSDGSAKKLFWNTKGSDLMDVFKTIADELSNLRIVG